MSPDSAFFLFLCVLNGVHAQTTIKLMFIIESTDPVIRGVLSEALANAEREYGSGLLTLEVNIMEIDRENLSVNKDRACAIFNGGVTMVIDMSWSGWEDMRILLKSTEIIYRRIESTIITHVEAVDKYLRVKNATDVAFIFESEAVLNETVYYMIGHSFIRIVVIDELSISSIAKIRTIRPSPSYYAIFASTEKMEEYFKTAVEGGMVKRSGIFILAFTDNNYQKFSYFKSDSDLNVTIDVVTIGKNACCQLIGKTPCDCPPGFQLYPLYVKSAIGAILMSFVEMIKSGIVLKVNPFECNPRNTSISYEDTSIHKAFNLSLQSLLNNRNDVLGYENDELMINYNALVDISTLKDGVLEKIGTYKRLTDNIDVEPGKQISSAKRYFRVGTTESIPWSSIKKDPITGLPMKDAEGKEIWEGYCIDFLEQLANMLNFEYDLVIPADGSFGEKLPNGQWTGLVGDLARGVTDISIGGMTMTSEREDVIDFVTPFFEISGGLVVMRKPTRKISLFKFMTVLKVEVWLSIVGALTLTGIMIWILDKYSPYSARNNKKSYPYPCREFTLKESFWFALTSFTPQGGGEAPKALSSRTLVAAYWLFVVLMLATFTANLAAFLTVERMQSPVQSLEQLARQSRINYTVLANSTIHQYFINMKSAEDKLYTVWKDISLNSMSDQVEYRVWDYPIKEQYGHILQAIMQVGPVKTAEEGFRKVMQSEKADFAFIHDSAEIKYEVSRNCSLTEVGEVFAEQPYAIAVQQGSHLQEEISRSILELQKDRYFERLAARYWNSSLKGQCPNSDDSEGITLESLGGVFIATLFGLALAMITLAGEVIYYRRRNAMNAGTKKVPDRLVVNNKTLDKLPGLKMLKPAPTVGFLDRPLGPKPRVSHISVYPRNFPFKE